jgi:hypothetical protein
MLKYLHRRYLLNVLNLKIQILKSKTFWAPVWLSKSFEFQIWGLGMFHLSHCSKVTVFGCSPGFVVSAPHFLVLPESCRPWSCWLAGWCLCTGEAALTTCLVAGQGLLFSLCAGMIRVARSLLPHLLIQWEDSAVVTNFPSKHPLLLQDLLSVKTRGMVGPSLYLLRFNCWFPSYTHTHIHILSLSDDC